MPNPALLSVPTARRILAYDRAVFGRFERRIRRLPRRAAFANREIGHHSYFGTLVHILHVHEAWLTYVVPGRVRDLVKAETSGERNPKDWASYDPYAKKVWDGVAEFGSTLTDRELRRVVRAPWMAGRYTVADAVLQSTIEEAHHLGEIIGGLWQEDRESPDMTWIEVGREIGAGSARARRRR